MLKVYLSSIDSVVLSLSWVAFKSPARMSISACGTSTCQGVAASWYVGHAPLQLQHHSHESVDKRRARAYLLSPSLPDMLCLLVVEGRRLRQQHVPFDLQEVVLHMHTRASCYYSQYISVGNRLGDCCLLHSFMLHMHGCHHCAMRVCLILSRTVTAAALISVQVLIHTITSFIKAALWCSIFTDSMSMSASTAVLLDGACSAVSTPFLNNAQYASSHS